MLTRFYLKSPLGFALAFIGVYVVGMSGADEVSVSLGMPKSITALFAALLSALLLLFVVRSGLLRTFGFCKSAVGAKKLLFYVPLVVLVSLNLWLGVQMNAVGWELVFYIVSMLFVGFLEELLFRGFLFRAMEKDNFTAAVIVSSVTFGIGHIVNLFNSGGAGIVETVCQIFYATAAGFLFVTLFTRTGSLVACILSHSLLNALSVFSAAEGKEMWVNIVLSFVLLLGNSAYALYVWRALPRLEPKSGT